MTPIDTKQGFRSRLVYDKKADKYIEKDYLLGKQPIGRATPLAAAMMDVHQFFKNDSRFETGTSGDKDPYGECRAKEVVLISDGYPEPEIAGGLGGDIGSESLTPAFGYNPDKYPYEPTEDEIRKFVNDSALHGKDQNEYGPRVNVVALSVATDATKRAAILKKLSRMARDGNTCAGYYLPARIPVADGGTCVVGTGAGCLVGPQEAYTYTARDGSSYNCKYPALILETNDRAAVESALFAVLSGIVGSEGTISRTKAAVSNFLDDDAFGAGGQYRVYSGVNTIGSYWRGILSRETIPCETTGAINFDAADSEGTAGINSAGLVARDLHVDVGYQVQCGAGGPGNTCLLSTPTDNRRMFTSIPAASIFQWGVGTGPATTSLTTPFDFTWKPAAITPTSEEFRETSVAGVPAVNTLVGTRIPFRAPQIHEVIANQASINGNATWSNDDTALALNAADAAELTNVVQTYRGHVPDKASGNPATMRVFSGILNSDPVVVPPPILDLPIESYRAFRSFYGDRPTMLYSATVDGTLHALHLGNLAGRIKVRNQTSNNIWVETDDASVGANVAADGTGQREAWSYMPFSLLRSYSSNVVSQGYLMDGATVVRDVRLCQADATKNQSETACRFISTTGTIKPELQWRTVLVQAMGLAGAGYFAMDVTRPADCGRSCHAQGRRTRPGGAVGVRSRVEGTPGQGPSGARSPVC
ncbi:MAG: hypothetical protein R3E66_07550 [bacterium]